MDNESKHTPEPWKVELTDDPEDGSDAYAVDCEDHSIALMDAPGGLALNEANARRIVACVNACEGIGTDTLERERSYVRGHKERERLAEENAKLREALKWTTHICDELLRDGDHEERAHIAEAYAALKAQS